jgi:hypothetical protein
VPTQDEKQHCETLNIFIIPEVFFLINYINVSPSSGFISPPIFNRHHTAFQMVKQYRTDDDLKCHSYVSNEKVSRGGFGEGLQRAWLHP